jgi:hypothetical protein
MLYLSILLQQDNHQKAYDVISGKLGDLFKVAEERLKIRAELLIKLTKWNEAHQIYQQLLHDNK